MSDVLEKCLEKISE